jgi:hypothetical protein
LFISLRKSFLEKKMTWSVTSEGIFTNYGSEHVFKKCIAMDNNHECIVMLEKPSFGFVSNESRKRVINYNIAKFRCNGLKVVLIFDLVDKIKLHAIDHENIQTSMITCYKVGSFVSPDGFDPDLDKVCAKGIHYFLSPEAAKSYDLNSGFCIINYIHFDENGCQYNPYEYTGFGVYSPSYCIPVSQYSASYNTSFLLQTLEYQKSLVLQIQQCTLLFPLLQDKKCNGVRLCKPSKKFKPRQTSLKLFRSVTLVRSIHQPSMRRTTPRYRGCVRS